MKFAADRRWNEEQRDAFQHLRPEAGATRRLVEFGLKAMGK
jgi:hypothetical protein